MPRLRDVDVAIVGAGPAALDAADRLSRAGAGVLVIDERPDPGHPHTFEIWRKSCVWAALAPDELGVLRDGQAWTVRPRCLLLATEAGERWTPVAGGTLLGVVLTGELRRMAAAERGLPGRRVVIGGNGPANLRLAAGLCRTGVTVAAVVEAASPGWRTVQSIAHAIDAGARRMLRIARDLATLRRAGVAVLWGSSVVAARGVEHVADCLVRTPGGLRRIDCDVLALGHGSVPSVELARQLGCDHVFVDRHVGYLATATDADGQTSVPGVWSIGAGADPAGTVNAMLRRLGRPGPPATRSRTRLRRAERFQQALDTMFRTPAFDVGHLADDTIVCRCESVTAGRVRRALTVHGASTATAKRSTRAGMGACQGRDCIGVIARLAHAAGGAAPGPFALDAPRAPVRPVPLGAIAREQPEWGGHVRSTPPAWVPRPIRPTMAAPLRTDVLVIGAGIVGACVARELARAGIEVLVVDRDAPGHQASTANAGSLHVQLLSFDFGTKAMAGGGPAAETLRLGPPALRLWQEIADAADEDVGLRVTGGLMLAETEAQLAFLAQKAALEARHGVETHIVGANQLRDLEPALSPDMIGAAYCPAEGKIDPLAATFAVLAQARRAGACVAADRAVLAIARQGTGFAVQTPAGVVRAGRIVNCAGAWSARISAMVGPPIPVSGAPLQMLVTQPGPHLTGRLIAHADRHLSLKQTASGALLIGGGWSAGLDARTGATRTLGWAMAGNAWVACRVLPAAARFNLLRAWAGMNVDIDGAPILGETPGVPGFWNCVTSNGYTLAPVVAAMTAQAMQGGRPDIELAPYKLDRF